MRFAVCDTGNTVVSRKYAPPFATLASVQNAGGAYTRDATISLAIKPPPPPFPPIPVPIKNDLIVGGDVDEGQARGIAKREAERCS